MVTLDVGQSAANTLYQQAVAGTFTMEVGMAKKCADNFRTFADSIDGQIRSSLDMHQMDGFGGFKSANDLKSGFEEKGKLLTESLAGMKAAALEMSAAFLYAGGQLEDADSMHKQSLAAATAKMNG